MDIDIQANRQKTVVAYICYAPPDEHIARLIAKHWAILSRTTGIVFTGSFDTLPGSDIADEDKIRFDRSNIIILILSADINIEQAFSLVESHAERLFVVYARSVADDLLELFKTITIVPKKPISEHKDLDTALALTGNHFKRFVGKNKTLSKQQFTAILWAIK